MDWTEIRSGKLSKAAFDDRTSTLLVKKTNGAVLHHRVAAKHVFDNLVESEDPSFYYHYYIKPDLIRTRRTRRILPRPVFKAAAFTAATAVLLMLLTASASNTVTTDAALNGFTDWGENFGMRLEIQQ